MWTSVSLKRMSFFCVNVGGGCGGNGFVFSCILSWRSEQNRKYRLIVFDDKKEVFIPLTEFYHDQSVKVP